MTPNSRPIDPANFDPAVPAADDFFRHVNGGWLDAHPVPAEYGAYGAFHEVSERNQELQHEIFKRVAEAADASDSASRMVGDYYAAAMDESAIERAGVTPLEPWLARIGAAHDLSAVRVVTRDLAKTGISAFFSAGVAPDFENSMSYLVYLGQGGLGLPERDYYLRDDERSSALRAAYAAHIERQFVNLGEDEASAAQIAARIVAFETRLAEASYPAEKMRDVTLTLNRVDASALDGFMPGFGLSGFTAELGNTLPTVCVDNPGFFEALEPTLAETPVETLRDYLRWNLVRACAGTLSAAFVDEAFDFYGRTLGGQQEQRPRWKRVLDAAGADIGEQVAQLYVAEAFSEDAKHRCEAMVEHLFSAMGGAIRGAEWMSATTKERALAKLAGFSYKIGYPDTWRDYSRLSITRDSYAANRLAASRFEFEREMDRLEEPVDSAEWAMPAHQINAYYHPLLNEIVFPAGILQPPFFHADADDAVNYGAIGAVIGHEITHGFDDQGSHFDENGSLRDWWSETDRTEFDRRAAVLVAQADEYEVADELHLNGRLTLGENIADLGGLSVSLAALREAGGLTAEPIDGFTPLQRFFLSWATVWRTNYTAEYARLLVNVDPHSPARYRVNAPLRNTPAFLEAFSIKPGSRMALPAEDRAHIW
ncbi:MAG: M13 family metallopeptidase [Coriobacteriia bacterium]|nr:M13 family metallopeptidase [Coriobacteriia bacterium]